MQFEVQAALRDLHEPTPAYLRQEIFHHGDLKTRAEAIKILTSIDLKSRSARRLAEMLRLTRN